MVGKFLKITFPLVVGSLFPVDHSYARTLTGKVISISDGDTIPILDFSNTQHKIRLYGIDCPESGQAFGKAAKKHTAKLTAKKTAHIKVTNMAALSVLLPLMAYSRTTCLRLLLVMTFSTLASCTMRMAHSSLSLLLMLLVATRDLRVN